MEWKLGQDSMQTTVEEHLRIFRVQRECMYQIPAKDPSQVRLAIMQWEEKWKGELGGDVQIPDLWRMSALLEICPKDVEEQMMMRLDEIGENCEKLNSKVVSCTTNKTEQARGRDVCADGCGPHGCSETEEEDWEDADEVRILKGKARAKGRAETNARGTPQREGQGDERRREEGVQANLEDTRQDRRENRKAGDTKGSAGHAFETDTNRQSVDGKSLASRNAAEVEDSLRETLRMWRISRMKAPTGLGADLITWQMKFLTVRKETAPIARVVDPSTGHGGGSDGWF